MVNRLKELRSKANITQETLAEKAGTDPTTISRLENAERIPGVDIASRIIQVLREQYPGLSIEDVWVSDEETRRNSGQAGIAAR